MRTTPTFTISLTMASWFSTRRIRLTHVARSWICTRPWIPIFPLSGPLMKWPVKSLPLTILSSIRSSILCKCWGEIKELKRHGKCKFSQNYALEDDVPDVIIHYPVSINNVKVQPILPISRISAAKSRTTLVAAKARGY